MYQSLRELRKSLKLTQKEFADKLGVSQPRIGESESSGFVSDSLKEKIESTFNVVLKSDKKEETETPIWVLELLAKIEKNWENERLFLLSQIEKKDKMLDALTEKLVKVEVSNWPPLVPSLGTNGIGNREILRVA